MFIFIIVAINKVQHSNIILENHILSKSVTFYGSAVTKSILRDGRLGNPKAVSAVRISKPESE